MNVLVVRNSDAFTNASIHRIVSALIEDGHTPTILSRSRKCDTNYEYIKKTVIIDGIEVENFELQLKADTGKGLKNLTILKEYIDLVKEWIENNVNDFDVIHAFDLDSGLIAKKICKKYNKYFVYHIADFYVDSRSKIPGIFKKIIKNLEFGIINSADSTIICTEERKKQIEGSKPKKLTVVHNSPSINENFKKQIDELIKSKEQSFCNKENCEKKSKIRLCYIGNLSKRRFIDQILISISKRENFELVLGGNAELVDMAEEYSRKFSNIYFLGSVPYEETFKYYIDSDIMFAIYNPNINNHRYSAANKIYEAMLLKKPIIVAKNTSMDVIVEKYDMGFTINFNIEDFEKLLDEIENNRNIINIKSKNMSGVYQDYSWIEMKNRIKNIYRDLGKER